MRTDYGKNMTMLPLAVVHAGTCMFVMHVYSTTSFCFLFWKVLKESFAIFMKHKKTHFNKYAFTNAICLRRGYTIAFPSIFNLFMRIHKCVLFFLWKHIPNIYIFHCHVIVGGNMFNTFAFTISVWFICWETHICIYVLSTYSRETHARVSMFLLANEEATHARSFVFWSILLDILTRFQMQLLSSLHTRPAIVFSREHCVSDMFCKAV